MRWLRDSHVARQFGWLAMAKIVQGVASLAAALAVARALGPVEFGALSLAIAIASFVAMIAALGLEQIATRELVAAERYYSAGETSDRGDERCHRPASVLPRMTTASNTIFCASFGRRASR